MRTTVDIPDELLRNTKEIALRQGQTLSRVVQEALEAFLDAERRAGANDEEFELIVRGASEGEMPSPARVHELLDEEERGG